MARRLIIGATTAALVVLTPFSAALAGGPTGKMEATPNPATVGDTVTVSNMAGAANTCDGGEVNIRMYDPADTEVSDTNVTPDAGGNWTHDFLADQAGTWHAQAFCHYGEDQPAGSPQAQPYFDYEDLDILVQAPGTSVPASTSTTTDAGNNAGDGDNNSGAANAASARPAFTG